MIGEESFTTSSSVYGRTFSPGKEAPIETGSRMSIQVFDFSAPFEETAETCSFWTPSDPASTLAPPWDWDPQHKNQAMVWKMGSGSPENHPRIWGLIICILSTGLHMFPGLYCDPQRAHHLGYSLDHCRVPRTNRLYQGLLALLRPLWRVSCKSSR